jgi:hypothetical protein
VTSFTPALLKKQSTTSQQYPSPLFNFATRGQSRYRHGINTRIRPVFAKAMPETLVLKTLSNLISVRRMSCPTTIFYASSQSRRADNAAVGGKMRDSPNEDMLVASPLGPVGSIIELPRNRDMRTVMRYVYGAVAFIGVVAIAFACLVALQRALG